MADDAHRSQEDVLRALGDSAVAGGLVGVVLAAAAVLAARLLRRRPRGAALRR